MTRNPSLLFLVCTLVYILAASEVAVASPAAKIAIEPASVLDVAPGATFKVNVTITDVVNLYGWQVNITFNHDILNVASTDEGPFLKNVNNTIVIKRVNNDGGFLLFSSSFEPPYPAQGATGSGLLVTITFTVKGDGTSSLNFEKRGTKLNTVTSGAVVPITDFTSVNGSFRNAAGGLELGFSLQWIAVIVIVVVGGVALALLLLRRKRRKTDLSRK